jgi:hypothetical protein
MKPLDVRSAQDHREATGQPDGRAPGKSGQGAASALEQLIRQERVRVLHNPSEPPQEHPPAAQ